MHHKILKATKPEYKLSLYKITCCADFAIGVHVFQTEHCHMVNNENIARIHHLCQ